MITGIRSCRTIFEGFPLFKHHVLSTYLLWEKNKPNKWSPELDRVERCLKAFHTGNRCVKAFPFNVACLEFVWDGAQSSYFRNPTSQHNVGPPNFRCSGRGARKGREGSRSWKWAVWKRELKGNVSTSGSGPAPGKGGKAAGADYEQI